MNENPYASPLSENGPSPWPVYLRLACGASNAFFCGQQFIVYCSPVPSGGHLINFVLGTLNLSAVVILALSAWSRSK